MMSLNSYKVLRSPKLPNHGILASLHLSLCENRWAFPVNQSQKLVTCGSRVLLGQWQPWVTCTYLMSWLLLVILNMSHESKIWKKLNSILSHFWILLDFNVFSLISWNSKESLNQIHDGWLEKLILIIVIRESMSCDCYFTWIM